VEYITEVNMLLIFLITIWDYSQLMKIRFFRSLWLCGWTYVFMVIEICLLLIPFGILLALYVKS